MAAVLLIAIPVIYFTIRWSLSAFVTMIEGISGGAALRRSSELCGGRFGLYTFHFALFQALVIVPSVVMSVGGQRAREADAVLVGHHDVHEDDVGAALYAHSTS